MNPIRLLIVLLLAALMCGSPAPAQPNGWEERFVQSNRDYKEGKYREAISGYHGLLEKGIRSGHLFYNLGNAYFKTDDLGRAILNYERARLFLPRDPDLRFNLNYARNQVQDDIPHPRSFLQTTFFWLDNLTLWELFRGFAVLNIFFWTVLGVRLFTRTEWTYYVAILFLIFWTVGGLSLGLKYQHGRNDRRAVILDREVRVLAGPDPGDTVFFKLHSGTLVKMERSEGDWSLIRLPDKKRGWVRAAAVQRITE